MGGKRSKNSNVKLRNHDIPEWFLVEVLIRLPTKIVHRFKLVSKQWLSIISDPLFVRTYISRASSLPSQPLWAFISHRINLRASEPDPLPEHLLLEQVHCQVPKSSFGALPLPTNIECFGGIRTYQILASSNGLVLYGLLSVLRPMTVIVDLRELYICNPVTRQWIALPYATKFDRDIPTLAWGFHTRVEDGYLKSYTVVRLESIRNVEWEKARCQVFFSEIGEWEKFTLPTEIPAFGQVKAATTLNGVMHWIINYDQKNCIIVYDPYRNPKHVRRIACPDGPTMFGNYSLCAEYKGKLRYLELLKGPKVRVWVLNDDHHSGVGGGGGGWSLQHKLCSMGIQLPPKSHIRPLSFHPFDSDVVYLRFNYDLISFNLGTKEVKVEQELNTPDYWNEFLLVIPPWPVSIARPFLGAPPT